MKVYTFKEYRDFIRARIEENRNIRGYQTLLAQAAGCQRSFLSQVLNTHVQLTPDHAAGLCKFWNLDDDETDYFIGLVNLARATAPVLKALLTRKLGEIRRRNEDLSARLTQSKSLSANRELAYYASWYLSAIHVIISIPRFRTPKAIAERLGLPLNLVQNSLAALEEIELIQKTPDGYVVTAKDIHLGKASVLAAIHHANWRQRTISRIQDSVPDEVHYTGVHALSARDVDKLREHVLEAIAKAREIIAPSPEEEVVFFGCDFYRL